MKSNEIIEKYKKKWENKGILDWEGLKREINKPNESLKKQLKKDIKQYKRYLSDSLISLHRIT
jgi:hypothetical protein